MLDRLGDISIGDVSIPGLLFRDDAIILAVTKQGLHNDLDKIEQWYERRRLHWKGSSVMSLCMNQEVVLSVQCLTLRDKRFICTCT